jgi:hypothetical protein
MQTTVDRFGSRLARFFVMHAFMMTRSTAGGLGPATGDIEVSVSWLSDQDAFTTVFLLIIICEAAFEIEGLHNGISID